MCGMGEVNAYLLGPTQVQQDDACDRLHSALGP
jgi:hypothetical protein